MRNKCAYTHLAPEYIQIGFRIFEYMICAISIESAKVDSG